VKRCILKWSHEADELMATSSLPPGKGPSLTSCFRHLAKGFRGQCFVLHSPETVAVVISLV
jgi:hypothetical protein